MHRARCEELCSPEGADGLYFLHDRQRNGIAIILASRSTTRHNVRRKCAGASRSCGAKHSRGNPRTRQIGIVRLGATAVAATTRARCTAFANGACLMSVSPTSGPTEAGVAHGTRRPLRHMQLQATPIFGRLGLELLPIGTADQQDDFALFDAEAWA